MQVRRLTTLRDIDAAITSSFDLRLTLNILMDQTLNHLNVDAVEIDPAIVSLALLSPTAEYRGLRIEPAIRKYGARPLLMVASDDDGYAARTVKELQKSSGGVREMILLSHAGHGTAMLTGDPDLGRRLVDWFRRTLL